MAVYRGLPPNLSVEWDNKDTDDSFHIPLDNDALIQLVREQLEDENRQYMSLRNSHGLLVFLNKAHIRALYVRDETKLEFTSD